MNSNDRSLLKQMIQVGRFNGAIYDLLVEQNKIDAAQKIQEMGDKWCCHPNNRVKRLDVPLPLLNDARYSKVLRKR